MELKTIMPKDIQKALAIGLTVFFLILFLGGRFMYQKSLEKLMQYKKQRQRVELENDVAKELEKLKKMREKVKSVSETSRFLAEIAKTAGQLNIKLKSISAMPVEKHEEYVKLSVTLEIESTYHEMGMFISKLEGGELFVSMDKLEVNSLDSKDSGVSSRIAAKIIATTFSITDTVLER